MTVASLDARFAQNLRSLGVGSHPAHFVLALSGGLDSTVLLHLLRFRLDPVIRITAAHFDHGMRAESAADARWAAGLCRAWQVDLETGAASRPLRGEADARAARYHFLFEVAQSAGARGIFTAHHADDQAETVLFRILRGTGIEGARGIPRRTRSGLIRPLLPFWREELERYAAEQGIGWRTDATNELLQPARNRLRLRVLPEIEREVAPAARRNLVAFADHARETAAAMRAEVRRATLASVRQQSDAAVLVRQSLAEYHPAVATRVLREVLGRFGIVLGRSGTRSLLQFITDASSGREMHLPGGVRVHVEFDLARIERVGSECPVDAPVRISTPLDDEAQSGRLELGGRAYRVVVRRGTDAERDADRGAVWRATLSLAAARFPLLLRSRRPGDRIRTSGGTKSLKKLMIERRVPRHERASRPVLADTADDVVWVAGIGAIADLPASGDIELSLAVYND